MQLNKISSTLCIAAVITLAGCATKSEVTETMHAQAQQAITLEKSWTHGQKLTLKGEAMRDKGQSLIIKGKDRVNQGEAMIQKGNQLIQSSEELIKEGAAIKGRSEKTFNKEFPTVTQENY